jgi:hypothetical protein
VGEESDWVNDIVGVTVLLNEFSEVNVFEVGFWKISASGKGGFLGKSEIWMVSLGD